MKQQEQIIECEKKLLEAMKTGNAKTLDELLHDSLIFIIPTGETITKSMDIENYKSGTMLVTEILVTDQVIKSIDDIFIVSTSLYLNAKYGDHLIDGKFRYLRVWKLFNNSWKVIAGSAFQIQ